MVMYIWLMYSWSLYKQTHILLALIEKKICKLNIFRIYYRNRLSLKSTDRPVPMQDASWINSVKCTYWFMQLLANAITNFIKYNLHQLCKAQDFFFRIGNLTFIFPINWFIFWSNKMSITSSHTVRPIVLKNNNWNLYIFSSITTWIVSSCWLISVDQLSDLCSFTNKNVWFLFCFSSCTMSFLGDLLTSI